ncbi:MAG TPA: WecB/TagA/CpsF family glycosyltransferase [Solirubrobacteraceae bacterium]|nr:WecB/TagA/CpsF family glycosyltransferase [Solirubrobacteraceae bacterium]
MAAGATGAEQRYWYPSAEPGGGAVRAARIFDVPIELAAPAEMLERIAAWIGDGPPARRVMYVNAHVLNQSRAIPALRDALVGADLVYCDGYGVRLAARALEVQVPHRMTGADWVWDLAALCERDGRSLYLLGSEPGVAAEAARRLRRRYPGLRIAGTHHGWFRPGSPHGERVLEDIAARAPDIVLIGMGTPKQELWAQAHAAEIETSVVWTVGALFDYVAGRVPRAPSWLADNGLEWIFRLAIEPHRMWRRYLLGNPVFVSRVMAQARAQRAGGA